MTRRASTAFGSLVVGVLTVDLQRHSLSRPPDSGVGADWPEMRCRASKIRHPGTSKRLGYAIRL
jgi:hypothetical protein